MTARACRSPLLGRYAAAAVAHPTLTDTIFVYGGMDERSTALEDTLLIHLGRSGTRSAAAAIVLAQSESGAVPGRSPCGRLLAASTSARLCAQRQGRGAGPAGGRPCGPGSTTPWQLQARASTCLEGGLLLIPLSPRCRSATPASSQLHHPAPILLPAWCTSMPAALSCRPSWHADL